MIKVELINDCFLMQSLYLSLVEGNNSCMKTVNNMLFEAERRSQILIFFFSRTRVRGDTG